MPIHFPIWEDIPIHLGRIQPNTFSNASETDLSTPHERKINTTMAQALQKMGNRQIYQNDFLTPHFLLV